MSLSAAELALAADAYKAFRQKRLDLQKQVDELKKQETRMKEDLLDALMGTEGLGGVVGQTCVVKHVVKLVPAVEDWDSLYDYIREHNAFELLTRKVTPRAVKDRWDAGEEVPGVITTEVNDLSVTKV